MRNTVTLAAIQIRTGSSDAEGRLLLVEGQLAAVLVRLDEPEHGSLRGQWFVEAGFERRAALLDAAADQVLERAGADPDRPVVRALRGTWAALTLRRSASSRLPHRPRRGRAAGRTRLQAGELSVRCGSGRDFRLGERNVRSHLIRCRKLPFRSRLEAVMAPTAGPRERCAQQTPCWDIKTLMRRVARSTSCNTPASSARRKSSAMWSAERALCWPPIMTKWSWWPLR